MQNILHVIFNSFSSVFHILSLYTGCSAVLIIQDAFKNAFFFTASYKLFELF